MEFYFAVLVLASVVAYAHAMKDMEHMVCMPSDDQIAIAHECYKEVTGQEPTADKAQWEELHKDKEMKTKLLNCLMDKLKIVENNNYNVENAEKAISDLNAEQSVKDALLANLKECAEKFDHSKVDDIVQCQEEKGKAICKEDEEE